MLEMDTSIFFGVFHADGYVLSGSAFRSGLLELPSLLIYPKIVMHFILN